MDLIVMNRSSFICDIGGFYCGGLTAPCAATVCVREQAAMQRFGLDFGTTNSSLAWARAAGDVLLCDLDPAAPDPRILRSLLYFSRDTRRFVVGQRAIDEYLAEDMHGVLMQSIKSFLGDESFESTWVHDRSYRLEDLIAIIFQHVRQVVRSLTADEVFLVIGRPAIFADRPEKEHMARERLRRAAQLAGFFHIDFQYEPIAAGFAYETSLDHPELALIADFGGGTSDFTVMRLGSGTAGDRRRDILASAGVQIGGDVFDGRIMVQRLGSYFGAGTTFRSMERQRMPFPKHLIARLGVWHQIPFLRSPKTMEVLARMRSSSSDPTRIDAFTTLLDGNYTFFLYREIEQAKSRLSADPEAAIRFQRERISIHERLRREELEQAIRADYTAIQRCMHDVLRNANVSPAQVRSVFLTGGSAQIPVIRRMFADEFGEQALKSHDYLTSVALGLGLTAWRSDEGRVSGEEA
jgi:hypothetical chaperone protein